MKILVIDDEEDARFVTSFTLQQMGGMEVVQAGSGEEGIVLAEKEKPDAILLDVMMPVMDGPSTLAALKNNPATASIPVIFFTAKVSKSEIDKLKLLGSNGVLIKPFSARTLSEELKAILAKSDQPSK